MKRKLQGITVPYQYYDYKRNYVYYVYKDKEYTDLAKVLKAFISYELSYHFEVREKEVEVHNLSEVLDNLLKFSDTFKIPSKYKDEYSSLEYDYIKGLKEAIDKDKLKVNYNPEFTYSITDFRSPKLYRFSRDIDNRYNNVVIPKRIKDSIYNQEYYVVGGAAYQSIYHALDVVYEGEIRYEYGGTKNPNNRTHRQVHNFDDLIKAVFKNSTKFLIHVHQQDFYSKQELELLKKLAERINEMGFKSVEKPYEKEFTEEYNYLKDHHRYIGILINNIKYKLSLKKYEREVLKSHKI